MGNYITTGTPLLPNKAKLLAKDTSGNTKYLIPSKGAGNRRRLLLIGNSLIEQSCRTYYGYTTTISAVDIRPGAVTIPLVAGGVAAAGLSIGDQAFIELCDHTPWRVAISGISGDTLTVAKPNPRTIRASQKVVKAAALTSYLPLYPTGGYGVANMLVRLLGGGMDLLPGYAHGGAIARDILVGLPDQLAYYRPEIVLMQLFENDITSGTPIAEMIRRLKWACNLCLTYGAIPVVATVSPSASYTVSMAVFFDAINGYIRDQLQIDFPSAIPIDPGAIYLTTANPTYPRSPLAGWTDGIHPNTGYQYSIAKSIKSVVADLFGEEVEDYHLASPNPTLAGTGGTATNLQAGSVVPQSTTIAASVGTTTTTTSKDGSDVLHVDFAVPGASGASSSQLVISQSITLPLSYGLTSFFKALCAIDVSAISGISMFQVEVTSGATTYAKTATALDASDSAGITGERVCVETPAFLVEPGKTSVTVAFSIRPQTLTSPSGVVFVGNIKKLGITQTPCGEMPL